MVIALCLKVTETFKPCKCMSSIITTLEPQLSEPIVLFFKARVCNTIIYSCLKVGERTR